jgi:hypothetical protein
MSTPNLSDLPAWTPASAWRLNAVIMQLKLASKETVNELLLPRTRRRWFV